MKPTTPQTNIPTEWAELVRKAALFDQLVDAAESATETLALEYGYEAADSEYIAELRAIITTAKGGAA